MTTGAGFSVVQPGVLTLVQDLGRFGYQHLGVSPGGAADEKAFLWANRLLDNPAHCPALEISLGGLQLKVQVATRIAITGADLQGRLNGQPLTPWRTYQVFPGDRLHFGYAREGLRGYLAVAGGFGVKPVLGSAATVMREQLGGLDGQGGKLQAGDWLPCEPDLTQPNRPWERRLRQAFIPDYRQSLTLRVIEGHQQALFGSADWRTLYGTPYRISPQSDRMGVRLKGEPLQPHTTGIASEGISFGAIQVPPDGQPIILLKDRQTIGGYPKLGTLLPLDAFALAQQQADTEVRFSPISLAEAQRLMRQFYAFFTG